MRGWTCLDWPRGDGCVRREPVLYLPHEPSVALLMDALPPSVQVDRALGTFASTSWTQELVPPALALAATALTLHLAL